MSSSTSTSTLINNTPLSNGAVSTKQNMNALPSSSPQPCSGASNLIQKQPNKNDNTPTFKIKTSKKWVLPPRPKPGRKPSQQTSNLKEKSLTSQSNSCSRKRSTKKQQPIVSTSNSSSSPPSSSTTITNNNTTINSTTTATTITTAPTTTIPTTTIPTTTTTTLNTNIPINVIDHELEESILKNPIKQEILKINEENYYLKLQVIKLVSDLKSLKSEVTKQTSLSLSSSQQQIPTIKKEKSLPKPTSPMDVLTDNGKIPCLPLSQSIAIPMSRKRSHDEDINDLIVSLLDLSHTTPSPESPSTTEISFQNQNQLDEQQQPSRKLLALPTPSLTPQPIPINRSNSNYLKSSPFINEEDFLNLSGNDDIDDIDDDELFDELVHNNLHETGTPNTMLSLTKTNETIESLSGSTLVSNSLGGSPRFKLIDIPKTTNDSNLESNSGLLDQDYKEFSIFDNVPSSVFSGKGSNTIMGDETSLDIIGTSGVNDDAFYSDYYEFNNGGLNDVEMEFENFINGGISTGTGDN